jgi:predicted pyridoxine 5'-phosphate oxidase superfamily flavin-nucleotide-binding protein
MKSFADIMFTPNVKAEQSAAGSRAGYEDFAHRTKAREMGEDEKAFVETRTSFYISSVNEDGWPYVQHRGGNPGFVKQLSPTQLGFGDYKGNRQYVTIGNLSGETRVALFLMDYPRKARLKILGHARAVDLSDAPQLHDTVAQGGIPATRAILIDIVAFDWNCPKYIEPRYTEQEIETMVGPKIKDLETRNAALQERLRQYEK